MEIKDYMQLPYTRLVQEMNDESGHYFYGRILELDGCQSTGDTLEELYQSGKRRYKPESVGFIQVGTLIHLFHSTPFKGCGFLILS